MKTKFTFIIIAIAALLGVGMLMASKNAVQPHQYLMLHSTPGTYFFKIDELGKIEETQVKTNNSSQWYVATTKKVNEISASGYKLVQFTKDNNAITYIFEKE